MRPLFLLPPQSIRLFPDTALRVRAREVTEFDQPGTEGMLTKLVMVLGNQLEAYGGVGMAAPQIGFASRLIVVADNEAAKRKDYTSCFALVNPRITWSSKKTWRATEGCLSVPGIKVEIERPVSVTVKAQDVYGEPIEPIKLHEWEARLFQHEIDHLDGVLHFDHLDRAERRAAVTIYMADAMMRGLIPPMEEQAA